VFFYSVSKLRWHYGINHILGQRELITKFGTDIQQRQLNKAKNCGVTSSEILWKLMAMVVNNSIPDNKRLLVVAHESFCARPEKITQTICDIFGMEFSHSMRSFIAKTTKHKTMDAPLGQAIVFNRDSKALARSWYGKISREAESIVYDVVGEDILFWEKLML